MFVATVSRDGRLEIARYGSVEELVERVFSCECGKVTVESSCIDCVADNKNFFEGKLSMTFFRRDATRKWELVDGTRTRMVSVRWIARFLSDTFADMPLDTRHRSLL